VKLKLQLVRDGEIVFDAPLSPMGEPRNELVSELGAFEEHFQRLSKLFHALSNETRLMMLKQLIEKRNHIISFSDFMRNLDLNPKLVWENTRKLSEGELLEKIDRGRYRCSNFGETGFILMSLALRRLIEAQENFKSFQGGEKKE
jgi:DNA-binding transcriptional ArsR family regulator